MERFTSVLLMLLAIGMLALASAYADTSYGKTPLKGYTAQKPDTPKDTHPKLPTAKPVVPKEGYEPYKKSYVPKTPAIQKPGVPKQEYKKSYNPKAPTITKPVVPIAGYKKSNGPKTPVAPKEGFKKSYDPKTLVITKPVVPKEEHGAYEKNVPKVPTKPVVPKHEEHGGFYGKGYDSRMPTLKKELLPKVPDHPKNIAVQGLIYCKYGSKLLPLQGATARVTCLAVHKNGYESAPFSFSSCPADAKGYFLAKISAAKFLKGDEKLWEITECKTFLEKSSWSSCNVPEDTNGGIHGAHLTFSRLVNGYRLSSVGPFLYNPGHESLPKEGY